MARIAVIGAGGIGAFFGGHWQAAGHDVLFCARRPFLTLQIESASAPLAVAVDCIDEAHLVPPRWHPAEWVFIAVKVHQTAQVWPWLQRVVGRDTRVVALQNGLDTVAALVGAGCPGEIVDSVVYCGAESLAPGRVRHGGGLQLVVADGPAAQALVSLSAGSAVVVTPTSDFLTAKWRKVLFNAAANGVTALTRRPFGVFARAEAAALAADLLAEGLVIARACGAHLGEDDTAQILAELRHPAAASVAPSMLQDRLAGRPTEHYAIYGAVVRAADDLGMTAPLHRVVQRLLVAGDP